MQKNNGSNRMARVNEELKRELSNIINYEVKNSNVTGMISVTKVKTAPDLKFAKVAKLHLETKNGPILLHKTNHFQINEHDTRKVSLMIRAIIAGKNCRDKENHSFSLY